MKKITVALAGNPNCGKTTLFNNLTGLRHHVGNWPGKTVTVEKKEGKIIYDDMTLDNVDLPGTYSLSGRSLEEEIAVSYLLNEKPDVVVNIVDAAHLERNLYVTLQLIELGVPLVLALDMNRYADAEGLVIDTKHLSKILGVPVVRIEAIDETGKDDLIKAILSQPAPSAMGTRYDHELEEHIREVTAITGSRWSAIQALIHGSAEPEVEKIRSHISSIYGTHPGEIFADQRYGFIAGILHESVDHMEAGGKNQSERIDKIITNRWFGFPIFLVVMYLIFQIVFTIGAPIMGLIEEGFGLLASLPFGVEYASADSLIGMAGSAIAPIFAPLGFGFAEAAVAILMGLLAKEVVVGAFGTLYGVGEGGLGDVLMNVFTPLSAYSFMVFILLYMPCLAAMFTMKQETRSWKLTGLAAVGMCVIAWIVSFIVYQGGILLGFA